MENYLELLYTKVYVRGKCRSEKDTRYCFLFHVSAKWRTKIVERKSLDSQEWSHALHTRTAVLKVRNGSSCNNILTFILVVCYRVVGVLEFGDVQG